MMRSGCIKRACEESDLDHTSPTPSSATLEVLCEALWGGADWGVVEALDLTTKIKAQMTIKLFKLDLVQDFQKKEEK